MSKRDGLGQSNMAVRTLLPTADEWDGLGQINTAMQVQPPILNERDGDHHMLI